MLIKWIVYCGLLWIESEIHCLSSVAAFCLLFFVDKRVSIVLKIKICFASNVNKCFVASTVCCDELNYNN